MPELPEVETIRRGLESKIIGLKLENIQVLNPKSFIGNPSEILNQKVQNLRRRGKVLIIDFSNQYSLLFHLKMSGQVIYESNDSDSFVGGHPTKDMLLSMPNKATRVIFEFADHSKLFFNDQRKFGWIKVEKTDTLVNQNFGLKLKLGPEPLESDFNPDVLIKNLRKHPNWHIKVALLDQTIVAGIGNIYASEALFYAGVDPRRIVSSLSDVEIQKIHSGILKSLNLSLEKGGSSKQHYFNESGQKGFFLDFAAVYDRKGLPCRSCASAIEKITLGGRGTYFCPSCQA